MLQTKTHTLYYTYASKKTGLAVNVEKIKYMFTSRDTQCRSDKYFKNAAKFKDLGKPNKSKMHSR